MLKIFLIIIGIILLSAVAVMFFMMKGPDLSKYKELKQPRISDLPNVKVLEISFEESWEGLGDAFGAIFKTYFKLKGVPKGPGMSPPLGRYETPLDLDLDPIARKEAIKTATWKGKIGIPIPDNITVLPETKKDRIYPTQITTWSYGATAEILHIGAYQDETPTVNKLKEYIQDQGYEISGLHEEVYLRGPGLFRKPESFQTIIRYLVKKIEQ